MVGKDRSHWPSIGLGVGLSAFAAFLQFKLPAVLPDFLQIYHHDANVTAGFMSIFALVGLVISSPLGRLLEGNRLMAGLILAFVLAALGLILGLIQPQSSSAMLSARALEGFAFAVLALIGPAIAHRASSRHDLPLVTGLLATWIPLGQILGGLLALAGLDWQGLWIVNLGLIPLLALACWQLRRRIFDGLSVPAETVPSLGVTGSVRLLVASGIFLLWSLQYFAFMTWLTQYLRVELALSRPASIIAYLLPVAAIVVLNIFTGLALRRGLRLLPALIAALFLQLAVWAAAPWLQGWVGIAALILYGVGAGIAPACLFHLPHVIAGTRAGPRAFGVLLTGRSLGVFLGPIVMAQLFQGALGWSGGALVIAALTAVSIVLALLLALLPRQGTKR